MSKKKRKIYTRDVAADIIDEFECLLRRTDIYIPDTCVGEDKTDAHIQGATYLELLDCVEWYVSEILREVKKRPKTKVIQGRFG